MEPVPCVHVVVPAADVDAASGRLWLAGATAIEERPLGPRVELVAGAPPGGAEALADAVAARWPARVVEVDDDDWLDAWRPHASAVRVGQVVVAPPGRDVGDEVRPGDVVVTFDPGRSFGTGSHPSTRLALEEVVARVRPGLGVLDVGCGGGVLAVVAARLGAAPVVAVDVDLAAVAATASAAVAAGVGDAVSASATPVADVRGRFELVVANIGAAALVAMAPALAARVAPGGALVASGLLGDRLPEVVAAHVAAGLELEATPVADGWAAAVLRAGR